VIYLTANLISYSTQSWLFRIQVLHSMSDIKQ